MVGVLVGRRILVLEEEVFLREDMLAGLKMAGAVPIGPARTAAAALALIAREPMDLAVVGLDLPDDAVWSVVSALCARGIPYVATTGRSRHALGPFMLARMDGAAWHEKPFLSESVIASLERAAPWMLAVSGNRGLSDAGGSPLLPRAAQGRRG